jgi:hypothetical protein
MKRPDADVIRDWWLKKFFNTTSQEVIEKYPKESANGKWFDYFKVTQAQYDEWTDWCKKDYLRKQCKISKSIIDRGWWSVFLQLAPSVIEDNNIDK